MKVVFQAMLSLITSLFNALLSRGGYIGVFVVSAPVILWIVRAVRSIINKK